MPAASDANWAALRPLLVPIYVPSFLIAAGLGAVIPVTPLFALELGGGVGIAGLVVAMRGLGTMALDIPAGLLIARAGDRRVMVWGAFAVVVAAGATSAVANVSSLVVLVFSMGAALSLWSTARLHLLVEQVPAAQRGRAMALIGGVGRLGLFAGPPAGGFLADRYGLEAAFVAQAGASFLGVLLLVMGNRNRSAASEARTVAVAAAGTKRIALRDLLFEQRGALAGAGFVSIVLQVLRSARHLLLPLWGAAIGLDVAEIGLVVGLSGGLDMLLFYPAGRVMDRRGRRATGVPSLLLMSMGLALLPLASDFNGLLAVGLLLGLGNGCSCGLVMTLGGDLSPEVGRSQFLGVWMVMADLGSAAGPLLVGGIAQALTLGVASVSSAALGGVGGLMLLTVVGETLRRAPVRRTGDAELASHSQRT